MSKASWSVWIIKEAHKEHTQEKNPTVMVTECGKCFAGKGELKHHLKIHSDETYGSV